MERRSMGALVSAAALILLVGGVRFYSSVPQEKAEIAIAPAIQKAPVALRRETRWQAARAEAEARVETQAKVAGGAAGPELPRSLRGTDTDGALRVGPDGKLVLGPDVLAFFDYFLTATGEESDSEIRARILAAIRERLDGPAAIEAIALLDQYMAYREAARTMRVPPGTEDDPRARLEAVRALRREQFGEEAASKLFGDEEQEGLVAIERSRVLKDPTLSPEQRDDRLRELEKELPEAAREARAQARAPVAQRAEEEAMRARGASEEEVRRHRVETVGEDGAERLEALDKRRAEWKRRVEVFRAERDRIAQRASDEVARQAAEQRLLEDSFTPEERLRVKAILAIPRP